MKMPLSLIIFLCLFALFGGACSSLLPVTTQPPALDQESVISTAAAGTAAAVLTQMAVDTLVAKITEIARATVTPTVTQTPTFTATATATSTQTPTETPLPPTETATATFTPQATSTFTPPAATSTPVSTLTPQRGTTTSTAIPCNWAKFVTDVTVPDGASFTAGERFVKTWRLKNAGSCVWTGDFALIFVDGDLMNGPAVTMLNAVVMPGQMIDVSVPLQAPNSPGKYRGYWQLRSPEGVLFGVGSSANQSFYVDLQVVGNTPNPPDVVLDLTKVYCSAKWTSTVSAGLTCPGVDNDSSGSVYKVGQPRLEGGYQDDEPAIITMPSAGTGGTISGRFPPFIVGNGYHFTSIIGCLYDSPKCDVTFQLNYSAYNQAIQNLATWKQISDNKYETVNIDLSPLSGQSVELILVVVNNGSSVDDRAFWLAPKVKSK